jgi:hypothetical protein
MSSLSRKSSAPGRDFKNPVTIKPCIIIGRMGNLNKAEFAGDILRIQSFWGGHGEISPKTCFIQEGMTARNIDSATDRVSNCHNSQTANRLEPSNRPSEG